MQLMICFTVSILLAVAVTGLPTGWELYLKNYRPHPPYDPPDIGPPSIDLKFFDHFPGITDWQKAYFKQVYQSAYSDLVQMIKISQEYSKAPSPAEVEKHRRYLHSQIRFRIRKLQIKTAQAQGTGVPKEGNVEVALRKVQERIRARTLTRPVWRQLQKEQQLLRKMIERGCNVEEAAEEARCTQEVQKITARIAELTRELQRVNGHTIKPDIGTISDPSIDSKNGNEFSVEAVGNGVKALAEGVIDSLHEASHRVIAGVGERQGGDGRLIPRPFGNFPNGKLGPIFIH